MYISSSTLHTTYSDKLAKSAARRPQLDPSEEWAHFIRDHIYQLRNNSTIVSVSAIEMNRYRYRVRDYITRVLNQPVDMELAFRIINNLTSDLKFDDTVTTVYVPNTEQLYKLRTKYATVIANYKRKSA